MVMVISGLTRKTPKPAGMEEGRKWMKNIVGEFLNLIEPDSASPIVFANQEATNLKRCLLLKLSWIARNLPSR